MMMLKVAAKVEADDLLILAVEYCNHQESIRVAGDLLAQAVLQAVLEVKEVEIQAMIHQWLTDGHLITLIAKTQ